MNDEYVGIEVKTLVKQVLKTTKENKTVAKEDMVTIRSNINKIDHEDAVNIDHILTILENENETEYQWGSMVLKKRWKLL